MCQFIFSTATDGKIKAWLYDNMGSRVDYNAPGHSSTTMAYSADGTRFENFFNLSFYLYVAKSTHLLLSGLVWVKFYLEHVKKLIIIEEKFCETFKRCCSGKNLIPL